ncbi:MAG: beta-aspartyl-peptidase, partial [Desulfococcaceae bacterium]
LIRNVSVFAPDALGQKDILIAGDRIAAIEDRIDPPAGLPALTVIDGEGRNAVPGLVDGHVHIMGGGGEAGFATRTPEMRLESATANGVTSVVGVRGTDGISRSMEGFVAKARGLQAEGISCWVLTGSYQVPVLTITRRIESDIMMIHEIIGVGEIAISDHRSSQPTFEELAKIGAAARIGGMLSGKSGVVSVHVGDGARGLEPLREVIQRTELPYRQFLPTHANRNALVFSQAMAYARDGGYIDFTTSTVPQFLEEGETGGASALRICLESGVPADRITFSSDGQGSMPSFDRNGEMTGFHVGTCASLFREVRAAVRHQGIPLETALRVATVNPAKVFKLPRKGSLIPGNDADIVLLNPEDLTIHTVMARGQVMVEGGKVKVHGTFA